jgi:hypothetical protein
MLIIKIIKIMAKDNMGELANIRTKPNIKRISMNNKSNRIH